MLPKCVETIDRLPHEGKDIVRSSRKLETRVHHWHGYRFCNHPESSARDRGCSHHNRRSHVRREEFRLISELQSQEAREGQQNGRLSFPFSYYPYSRYSSYCIGGYYAG